MREKLVVALMAGMAGLSWMCLAQAQKPASAPAKQAPQAPQKIAVHLSRYTTDLHAAAMALGLARTLQQQGAQVTLMLDVEGVRLADTRLPQTLGLGGETPLPTVLDEFIKAGGKVLVCGHCSHVEGLESKHVRAGAQMADSPATFASALMVADKVIDY